MAVADHDLRLVGARGHAVQVEQQRGASAERRQLRCDRRVIGRVGRRHARGEARRGQGAFPQRAVALGARRDDPQPVARARADRGGPDLGERGRIDLVRGAVAVDRAARGAGDDRAEARRQRPPRQPVDQRILERCQRAPPVPRLGEQPGGIIAPRMGDRQRQRQRAARGDDQRRGEGRVHPLRPRVLNLCGNGAAPIKRWKLLNAGRI